MSVPADCEMRELYGRRAWHTPFFFEYVTGLIYRAVRGKATLGVFSKRRSVPSWKLCQGERPLSDDVAPYG